MWWDTIVRRRAMRAVPMRTRQGALRSLARRCKERRVDAVGKPAPVSVLRLGREGHRPLVEGSGEALPGAARLAASHAAFRRDALVTQACGQIYVLLPAREGRRRHDRCVLETPPLGRRSGHLAAAPHRYTGAGRPRRHSPRFDAVPTVKTRGYHTLQLMARTPDRPVATHAELHASLVLRDVLRLLDEHPDTRHAGLAALVAHDLDPPLHGLRELSPSRRVWRGPSPPGCCPTGPPNSTHLTSRPAAPRSSWRTCSAGRPFDKAIEAQRYQAVITPQLRPYGYNGPTTVREHLLTVRATGLPGSEFATRTAMSRRWPRCCAGSRASPRRRCSAR